MGRTLPQRRILTAYLAYTWRMGKDGSREPIRRSFLCALTTWCIFPGKSLQGAYKRHNQNDNADHAYRYV
jgi:hypothetical protein